MNSTIEAKADLDGELAQTRFRLHLAFRGFDRNIMREGIVNRDGYTFRCVSHSSSTIRVIRISSDGTERDYVLDIFHLLALARLASPSLDRAADDARLASIAATLPEPGEREAHQLARKGDRDTSKQAAKIIAGHINPLQERVLAAFKQAGDRGLTDVELDMSCGGNGGSTYRTRRAELTEAGKIVDSGKRRIHEPSRAKRIVWRLA